MSQNRTTEIIDIVFNKDINALNVNNPGFMNQNNSPFNGIFGSRLTTSRKEQFSANFTYPPDTRITDVNIIGSGSSAIINSLFTAESGITTGSSVEVETKRALRYRAGRDAELMFTGIFTPGTGDSVIRIGIFNGSNGFAIGFIGDTFTVMRQYDGVWVDEIAQSNFNQDRLDGSGDSEFFIDPTKMNIFRITYGYLGIAPIFFQVYGGKNKGWVTFHIIDLTNQQTITHVKSPYLPVKLYLDNGTTTDALKFETGSIYAGTYGSLQQRDASERRFSIDISPYTTIGTSEQRFVVFHNKTTFQGVPNKIEDILAIFQASLDAGAKPAKVRIYNVPEADIVGGTFVDVNTINSNLEYADSVSGLPVVSLANAQLYTIFTMEKDGNIRVDTSTFGYTLFPNEYAVFTIESSTNTIIDASIDEIELF